MKNPASSRLPLRAEGRLLSLLMMMAWAQTSAGQTVLSPDAASGRNWTLNLTPQLVYGSYQNSPTRNRFASAGLAFDAQYLERGGLSFATTHTDLKYKNGTPTLHQNAVFASGRINFTPDGVPGFVTLRGDLHQSNNNDATNESDDVRALTAQLAFLNFDKSQYYDLGYTFSRYGDSAIGNPSLRVRQLTPTLGFAFNQGADWMQLRLYDIRFDKSSRTQNRSSTDAVEAKWTHFMRQKNWMPEKVQVAAVMGKRMYAVDGDTATVFNLADLHRGGLAATAQWQLATRLKLQLNGGYNRHETHIGQSNISYSVKHIYSGLNAEW